MWGGPWLGPPAYLQPVGDGGALEGVAAREHHGVDHHLSGANARAHGGAGTPRGGGSGGGVAVATARQ
eukprot:3790774-Prymnesium_polylepis.1